MSQCAPDMTKGDCNDYSRFNAIADSDSDDEPTATDGIASKKPVIKCASCFKIDPKLKPCARCKSKHYCNAKCQRADWKFHKRICVKPSDKKKEAKKLADEKKGRAAAKQAAKKTPSSKAAPVKKSPAAPKPVSTPSKDATASSTSPSTAAGTSSSTSSSSVSEVTSTSSDATAVMIDEDDAEDMAALKEVSKGYRYFSRTASEKEKELIGDIAPKKVVAASLPKATSSAKSASVWNSGGTWEEKDKAAW